MDTAFISSHLLFFAVMAPVDALKARKQRPM
jgi:hypothetical protein